MARPRDIWLIRLALVLVTFGVYSPILWNDFVNFDDPAYVTENDFVQAGVSARGIAWAFTDFVSSSNWHPVTWLSHMLDCQMYGLDPMGHHLTSLMLHLANTLLLLELLRRMTGATGQSAVVAALFAWHPLHVESVAWISERKDVLSTLFWLLTTFVYVLYVEAIEREGTGDSHAKSNAKVYYGLALLAFALGLMSKPMAVTLPFVLLLLDYWPLRRFAVREKFPLIALAVVSSVVTVVAQKAGGSVETLSRVPMGARAANAAVACCRYLERFVWPHHLSAYYPPVPAWPVIVWGVAALFLGAVTFNAFRARRTSPYLVVGWLWFLGTLVPVIGLVQVGTQSMADRYTYLPSIGLFIMVVWELHALSEHWVGRRWLLASATGAALAVCLAVTWNRVHDWRNSGTLFSQSLAVSPVNNFMAHTCLGMYLGDEGKHAEAIEHFQAALKTAPTFYMAHFGLGRSLAAGGKIEGAVEQLEAAIKDSPNFARAHQELGEVLVKQGKTDEANVQFAEARRLKQGGD